MKRKPSWNLSTTCGLSPEGNRGGPRGRQKFVFRYQLARMLLMALEHKFEPRELVAAIGVASDRSRKERTHHLTLSSFELRDKFRKRG